MSWWVKELELIPEECFTVWYHGKRMGLFTFDRMPEADKQDFLARLRKGFAVVAEQARADIAEFGAKANAEANQRVNE